MFGDSTVFGVNFVDGRIKGYPKYQPPANTVPRSMYFRMVRGTTAYGINNFEDNGDGTITDRATGLMWQQADDGNTYDWEHALAYADSLTMGGHGDWRLPNAKELQSIVDYTRCPDATNSAAIDTLFSATSFNDPDSNPGQYGHYWTGTIHQDGTNPYDAAVYIAFGEAQGRVNGTLVDAHGAGAQRSDPKTGDPALYPQYVGPQGDVRYVFNYARAVRDVPTAILVDCGKDGYEPNDEFATAANIFDGGVGGFEDMRICPAGDQDWFKLSLSSTQNLKIRLENLPADFNVYLHDPSGNLLASSTNSSSANELILFNAAAPGTYYINVSGVADAYNATQPYDLLVNMSFPTPVGGGVGTKPPVAAPVFKSDLEGPSSEDFFLYPNPAMDFVTLRFNSDHRETLGMQVLDRFGRMILSERREAREGMNELTLDISSLSKGIYFVTLQSSQGIKTHKLVLAGN